MGKTKNFCLCLFQAAKKNCADRTRSVTKAPPWHWLPLMLDVTDSLAAVSAMSIIKVDDETMFGVHKRIQFPAQPVLVPALSPL